MKKKKKKKKKRNFDKSYSESLVMSCQTNATETKDLVLSHVSSVVETILQINKGCKVYEELQKISLCLKQPAQITLHTKPVAIYAPIIKQHSYAPTNIVQESNTSNVQDLKNMLKACLSKWELY
jgi:hypothetical protein